jgi:endonuclease/exonuclease/phosphatase (EEP) superfamily protein YafD
VPAPLLSLLETLSVLIFLAGAIATTIGFLGRLWWVLELFSHFRWQYLVTLLTSLVLALAVGSPWLAVLSGLFAAVNLALIVPLYRPVRTPQKEPGCRLLLANVLQPNREYGLVDDLIKKENPDVIVLVEINSSWVDGLVEALEPYTYRKSVIRDDHYGLGIFSRCPISRTKVHSLPKIDGPVIEAQLELDGRTLTLLALHPPPPKKARMASQRNLVFRAVSELSDRLPRPLMLAGDLNTSSWSPFFKDLLRGTSLRDSRVGFGLQNTWPSNRPHLLTQIDHVLVSDEIEIHSRRVGPFTGSDHYPVLLDFSIAASQENEQDTTVSR